MTTTAIDVIDRPGIYPDVDELDYHADSLLLEGFGPSLSSTGAKLLLPPSCPALFRHAVDNGRPDKPAFDLGHAVHAKVLGIGLDIAVIPDGALGAGGTTGTKAAKEFIAKARAAGQVPIKSDVAAQVDAIAEAVLAHPIAGAVLSEGQPEQSAYAIDSESGVTLRARIDWLRDNVAADLKTVSQQGGSNPAAFGRTVANYGYHIQAAHYTRVLGAIGMDVPFIHILAETEPPYLVSVVQLDDEAMYVGRDLDRQAIDTYAVCARTDTWPGFSDDIETVTLPRWAVRN